MFNMLGQKVSYEFLTCIYLETEKHIFVKFSKGNIIELEKYKISIIRFETDFIPMCVGRGGWRQSDILVQPSYLVTTGY